jgi:uncharacterized protein (DUF885 family)
MSWITAALFLGFTLAPAPHLSAQTASVADRSAALDTLFKDVWEDHLKRSPEFASAIGDRRYNDQLTDLSASAFNDELARRRVFLTRLLTIDTTGLPERQRVSAELLQRQLTEDEEAARFKQWELPIQQGFGVQANLVGMIEEAPFATVKDYDDYIARLHKIPAQLRQASENLLAGIDDHRVQPASVINEALVETEQMAGQKPEVSPFAIPLARFPAGIDAPTRKRISAELLDAVQTDVLPAYARFARFLRVVELPAATRKDPLPDHPFSFEAFELRILGLRSGAKGALGPKFNLQGFHDVVASSEALPLDTIAQRVDAWIAASR